MPLELLQDSDSSQETIDPHWASSFPEYLSPDWDKGEQRRVVWSRLRGLCALADQKPSKQTERYQTPRQEYQKTQVESSHELLFRDIKSNLRFAFWDYRTYIHYWGSFKAPLEPCIVQWNPSTTILGCHDTTDRGLTRLESFWDWVLGVGQSSEPLIQKVIQPGWNADLVVLPRLLFVVRLCPGKGTSTRGKKRANGVL